jgi:hypothetical protein
MVYKTVVIVDGQRFESKCFELTIEEVEKITDTYRKNINSLSDFQLDLDNDGYLIIGEEMMKKSIFLILPVTK